MPDALLVVEDEPAMAAVMEAGLSARGYAVRTVATGSEAIGAVDAGTGVVVLDLGLPDVDGIDVCRRIRAASAVPIIVVTADGAVDRKVAALDAGADDYVTKPFAMLELLARVRVALRHRGARTDGSHDVLEVDDLVIDTSRRWATAGGRLIDLTPREFDLLAHLARHPGRVLTHGALLAAVWGPEGEGHTEYLRVYARSLRKKLGDDPDDPRLVTEPGVGYRLINRRT